MFCLGHESKLMTYSVNEKISVEALLCAKNTLFHPLS